MIRVLVHSFEWAYRELTDGRTIVGWANCSADRDLFHDICVVQHPGDELEFAAPPGTPGWLDHRPAVARALGDFVREKERGP